MAHCRCAVAVPHADKFAAAGDLAHFGIVGLQDLFAVVLLNYTGFPVKAFTAVCRGQFVSSHCMIFHS